MHDVSKAINILDPVLNPASGKKNEKWKCLNATSADTAADGSGNCMKGDGAGSSGGNFRSLKDTFKDTSKVSDVVGADTAAHISGRMTSAEFSRAEKGVVSSAFAKAHEGAEIVIAVDIHL